MSSPPGHAIYFAYGSNMLSERIVERAPSARKLGAASLPAHRLLFDKRGWKDGSGKCRLAHTVNPQDIAWGILYRLSPDDRTALDRAEGVGQGYEVHSISIELESGEVLNAFTYMAQPTHIEPALRPFTWYRDLVLAGAAEHQLPAAYLAQIAAVAVVKDANAERVQLAQGILRRTQAGI